MGTDSKMAITWIVLYCDATREYEATDALRDQAYEPYCPSERYYSRRFKVKLDRPLFSRYIFCGLDIKGRQEAGLGLFSPIRGTKGVREILGSNGRPTALDGRIIEALRKAEALGLFDATPARLKTGDKVRVTDGPFAHMIGQIKMVGPRLRIQVLFSVMGREAPAWVPLPILERV